MGAASAADPYVSSNGNGAIENAMNIFKGDQSTVRQRVGTPPGFVSGGVVISADDPRYPSFMKRQGARPQPMPPTPVDPREKLRY